MLIEIKDGKKVEIIIGDEIESVYQHRTLVTVIGINLSPLSIAYTYPDLDDDGGTVDKETRAQYSIPEQWLDGQRYYATGSYNITAVHPKGALAKAEPTTDPDAQARAAAWGVENYAVPKGAAFEFL